MNTVTVADDLLIDNSETWYSQAMPLAPANTVQVVVLAKSISGSVTSGFAISTEVSDDLITWSLGNISGITITSAPDRQSDIQTASTASYATRYIRVKVVNNDGATKGLLRIDVTTSSFQ